MTEIENTEICVLRPKYIQSIFNFTIKSILLDIMNQTNEALS